MPETEDIVTRLRNERRATRWTRGVDADYPVAWEPHPLCAEAATTIATLRAEVASLKTVMVAAAEEISAHWQAHCDAEGYGPQNLVRRLEEGIPSEYGYTAGAFAALRAEVKGLRADAERYRWLRQYGNGIYMDVFNDDDAEFLVIQAAGVRLDAAIDAAKADK